MQQEITQDGWKTACQKAQKHSVNIRLSLLQKTIYLTAKRWNQWYPDIPDVCFKCRECKGTKCFITYGAAPKLQKYWKLLMLISGMVRDQVPCFIKLCLPGYLPNTSPWIVIDFWLKSLLWHGERWTYHQLHLDQGNLIFCYNGEIDLCCQNSLKILWRPLLLF